MPLNCSDDRRSEMIKDYTLAACAVIATICVIAITMAVNRIERTTNESLRNISNQTCVSLDRLSVAADNVASSTASMMLTTSDAIREVKENSSDLTRQARLFILDTKKHYVYDQQVKESLVKLMSDADQTILNTDASLNGPDGVLTRTSSLIRTVEGKVVVLFDHQIAGILDVTCTNIDDAGQAVVNLLNNPDIPAIVKEVRVILENGEQVSFYAAEITGDAAELSEHYKNKLTKPTKWEITRQVLMTTLYILGEVVVPLRLNRVLKDIN